MGLYPPHETNYFPVNYNNVYEDKNIVVDGDDTGLLSDAASNEDFYIELFLHYLNLLLSKTIFS